ncbi:concanavalin A-like lectin/glucanase domain-containing protein [Daedaleopsis nitida]|nr:concanavalin A-like lectin/glucanase domain-containing protein [Daedaleopsis nitida]
MRFHLPLLVFLLANTAPSDAGLLSRGTESLARTANRLHRRAAKHSAGLAKDLRRAFSGMYAQELPATTGGSQRAYCVNNANGASLGNATNTSPSDGSNGTFSSSVPSSTSASPAHSISSESSSSTKHSSTTTGSKPSPSSSSPWKLTKNYQGNSFFDGWDFFTGDDPTHGIVDYVDRNTAQSSNLVEVNDAGNAIMRVDTTPQVSGNRRSVRITTTYTYTGALVLLDAVHMPTGCATWPAFWSNGPNWPNGGEIDILEGVNDYSNNQATIHTAHGCTISSSNSDTLGITGTVVGGTNCAALETSNAGCGMVATQSNTYGVGFNNNGGGVYAMQWVDDGVTVWFFPRNNIPSDISAGAPLPNNWGKPMASWPASHCSPSQFFHDHSAIFDTTLCGDWAGGVWNNAGAPGQEQSCAARVGVSTCEEFVRNHGSSFNEAYWEVKSVKIYQ